MWRSAVAIAPHFRTSSNCAGDLRRLSLFPLRLLIFNHFVPPIVLQYISQALLTICYLHRAIWLLHLFAFLLRQCLNIIINVYEVTPCGSLFYFLKISWTHCLRSHPYPNHRITDWATNRAMRFAKLLFLFDSSYLSATERSNNLCPSGRKGSKRGTNREGERLVK